MSRSRTLDQMRETGREAVARHQELTWLSQAVKAAPWGDHIPAAQKLELAEQAHTLGRLPD